MQKVQNEANKSFRISESPARPSQDPPLAVTPDGRDGRPYIEFVHVSKSFDDQPGLQLQAADLGQGQGIQVSLAIIHRVLCLFAEEFFDLSGIGWLV